ncbi:hypothetical protein HID58_078289 [Brassica napus]|uniref:Uncharacterized protein n=6 Tax=Brassica TaxID=3705 RepID=A0ABQ7YT15_BRANA|nr:hypothetical protein HID58_078289 [Brassica napus]
MRLDICYTEHEQSNPTLTTWHNYITHNILTTLFLKLLTSINSHSICILNKRRRRRKRKTTISAVLEPFLPEKYVSLPGTESHSGTAPPKFEHFFCCLRRPHHLKVSSSSPPMDLPVAGSSPSPCLPPEPPDAELYVRLQVDPPDPPVPPTLHRFSGPMLFTTISRHFAPPLSITVNRKGSLAEPRSLCFQSRQPSSSLMGSDDQRLRPSSAKAYWIQNGNADAQSLDLTKVYVLSLNPINLISLVWYDVFNGSLMVYVHRLASVYRVHIAQSRDVVLEFVPLLCQLSQGIRVFTVFDPFLMNIRVISRQRRPFPTARSYGSRDTQLLLPANSFRQSSIENPRRSHPPMVLSVTYLLDELSTEKTLGETKEEEVEEMVAETGMVMVGVLGLWARFVRKPLLEFTGEIIKVASEVVSRMCGRDTDTASYNSSPPIS